ncbi:acyl carrier protein [Tautonia sociabilis]|uniref:Acyl carrier protein n=1 Tax=Tautonia sociabilis TaxID=2080755 RepID=A0A432MGA7_9BACT|nr:acyl carrier protein [Tautonia sociabilis]RUL85616.1 acyl carrier protein [Tautonia sociabilis]
MPDPQLFDAVCGLIRSVVKLDAEVPMTPDSTLVDDLGVDSLDLVSVFLEVQDAFGVVIDEEDLTGIVSVGDLVAYVAERRASQAA